jgi:MFS family permease
MVTLDVTIVNIALPTAQQALHFSTDQRQWVITAYALSFGSLLLLGGKLGDVFGLRPLITRLQLLDRRLLVPRVNADDVAVVGGTRWALGWASRHLTRADR